MPPEPSVTRTPSKEKPKLSDRPAKRLSSKKDKKPNVTATERRRKAMSTFRSDSVISRQKEMIENPDSKPVERQPSLIESKRPMSMPPVALPPETFSFEPETDLPNPFAFSSVVPIQTRNPHIAMNKMHSNTNSLNSSNPFLHEIESGLGDEVADIDPATNPFLLELHGTNSFTEDSFNEKSVLPSPPATSPPYYSSRNPFFDTGARSDSLESPVHTLPRHHRKVSQDSNVSSGSGTLGRRTRNPLRSAVMGTSMVEFLRSQSLERAEAV
jgi:hypothetical protein